MKNDQHSYLVLVKGVMYLLNWILLSRLAKCSFIRSAFKNFKKATIKYADILYLKLGEKIKLQILLRGMIFLMLQFKSTS